MLDEIFFKKRTDRHRANYILFSFVITVMAFLTAWILFPNAISYTFPLIATILLIPFLRRLIGSEELEIVKKRRLSHIFRYHSDVVEIMVFIFIGIFLATLMIQLVSVGHADFFAKAFDYQITNINQAQQDTFSITDKLIAGEHIGANSLNGIFNILFKVFGLVTLGFLLGTFYGSGGILIIVIAAARFSTFILYLLKSSSEFLGFFILAALLYLLLLIPLILAAIAGGIISKAIRRRKIHSKNFEIVLKDGGLLYISAVVLSIILSALWLGTVLLIFAVK